MNKDNRLLWANSLRAAATLAVIVLHVSVSVEDNFGDISMPAWVTANLYDIGVRWCVPVFVMLTGTFALNNYGGNLKNFLFKTFQRIVMPFLFWSVVYLFYYNGRDLLQHKLSLVGKASLIAGKFAEGTAVHLWYVYMIIGMYLLIPILYRWVQHNNRSELIYFISLWLLFLFVQPLWDKYDISIDINYFTGYIGYLILGNFLYKEPRKVNSMLLFLIFIAALAYTCIRTYRISVSSDEMDETYMENLMPNIVVMSICIYLLFKNSPVKFPMFVRNIIGKVCCYSYGIYLAHILVLDLVLEYMDTDSMHPVYSIPLISLFCLGVSYAIIYVLNKIPYVRFLAG